jgi:hypothetical protein
MLDSFRENRRVEHSATAIAPRDLADTALRELWAHWEECRPADGIPARSQVNPLRFPRLLPQVFIMKVEESPTSFVYSLVGEANIEAHGANFTGLDVRDLNKTWPGYGTSLHDFYTFVAGRKKAVAVRGDMRFVDRGFRHFESVYLPLAGKEGETAQILGAAAYDAGTSMM